MATLIRVQTGQSPGRPTPAQGLPANAGQSGIDVSGLAGSLATVFEKIQNRDDALARNTAINELKKQILIESDKFRTASPLPGSTPSSRIGDFMDIVRALGDAVVDSHPGSTASRDILRANVDDLAFNAFGTALQNDITRSVVQADDAARLEIAAAVKRARDDPMAFIPAFEQLKAKLIEIAGPLDARQKQALLDTGAESLVMGVFERFFAAGDAVGARQFFDANAGTFAQFPPSVTGRIQQQIGMIERLNIQAQKEAQIQIAVANAKRQTKLDVIQGIFNGFGLGGQLFRNGMGGPFDHQGVNAPFADGSSPDGSPPSQGAQDLARAIAAGKVALQAGEFQLANSLFRLANTIAANDPEIARNKELDKSISPTLAALFGVEVGTTFREVMNRIPPSIEEQAFQRRLGEERAEQLVKDQTQVRFLDQAVKTVEQALKAVQEDPTIFGGVGKVRQVGQNVTQLIKDIFGNNDILNAARDIAFQSDLPRERILGLFDNPNLSTLQVMENSIGLILARTRVPDGRIPADVIDRSIDDVRLTGFTGSEAVRERLRFVLDLLNSDRRRLLGESGTGGPESSLPVFVIDKDGKLVPLSRNEGQFPPLPFQPGGQ